MDMTATAVRNFQRLYYLPSFKKNIIFLMRTFSNCPSLKSVNYKFPLRKL